MWSLPARPGAAPPAAEPCSTSGRARPAPTAASAQAGRGGRLWAAAGGASGSGAGAGGRKDKQQQELQDLLIDPAYDPLFDGIDEDSSFSGGQDPFQASGKQGGRGKAKRSGRPVGTARTKTGFDLEASEDYYRRRQREREDQEAAQDTLEEEYKSLFGEGAEPVGPRSDFDLQLQIMRWNFMQQQQEEVMELHHAHRATEVSAYAQATALAHLMEHFEREDEVSGDPDPLPTWIRAKKTIAANWPLMEQLAGSRAAKMRAVQEFQGYTPERQHLIDTWDESLYAGQPDPEEREYEPDYMDQFLRIRAPEQAQAAADAADAPASEPQMAPSGGDASGDDLMSDLMPDLLDELDD